VDAVDVLPLVPAGLDQPALADVSGHPLQVFGDLSEANGLGMLAGKLE